jgi:antitoxin component YwqK of YwqJK toxin-antitoxin module
MKTLMMSLLVLAGTSCLAQNAVNTVYEDGSVKSEYVKKDGLVFVTHYYPTGAVKETGAYKNEIPEGRWETFAENGVKTAELNYVDGKRHGEFRVWDIYADTYIEMAYLNGEAMTAKRYLKQTEFAAKDR